VQVNVILLSGGLVTGKSKLIRDKVPQIIQAQGVEPIVRVAGDAEYRQLLRAKLVEEAGEVATADDAHAPEELADVIEVVLSLAAGLGIDAEGLEKLRAAKAAERGSFTERIVWCGNLNA
jgi:predicted house-cleaning noncanonical NTP pyrophosphatase (MazG superfamily)